MLAVSQHVTCTDADSSDEDSANEACEEGVITERTREVNQHTTYTCAHKRSRCRPAQGAFLLVLFWETAMADVYLNGIGSMSPETSKRLLKCMLAFSGYIT